MATLQFLAKRDSNNRTTALVRVRREGNETTREIWSHDGWVPASLESTGIGGSADYDPIEPEEAVLVLIEFGADEINPTL